MLALATLFTSLPQRLHNSFLTPFERFESERHRPQYTSILVYSDARNILKSAFGHPLCLGKAY